MFDQNEKHKMNGIKYAGETLSISKAVSMCPWGKFALECNPYWMLNLTVRAAKLVFCIQILFINIWVVYTWKSKHSITVEYAFDIHILVLWFVLDQWSITNVNNILRHPLDKLLKTLTEHWDKKISLSKISLSITDCFLCIAAGDDVNLAVNEKLKLLGAISSKPFKEGGLQSHAIICPIFLDAGYAWERVTEMEVWMIPSTQESQMTIFAWEKGHV